MDSILEKFYKSEYNYGILKIELDKIKNESIKNNEDVKEIIKKIHNLEILIESIKLKNNNSESFWSAFIDFTVKLIYVFIVSYILYILGWESPPV